METCADACSSVSIDQPCGGTVLQCLSDKIDTITSEDCKKEVFYFQKMEVRDFRNDVILAETCRADVDTYCADVEAGESPLPPPSPPQPPPPTHHHSCSGRCEGCKLRPFDSRRPRHCPLS